MPDNACQIYLITPPSLPDLSTFAKDLTEALSSAPVACLQLRLKEVGDDDILRAAEIIRPICHAHETLLIMNDRPDLAKFCDADGVHIGQDDMDYFSSRELLGEDAIIGVTCHNSRELAFSAASAGANYVAFGAFFETPTKSPKTRAEPEILEWWNEAVEIPCVAIGGITEHNAAEIIQAGADFIAVSSGVWNHPDGPATAVQRLHQLCSALA